MDKRKPTYDLASFKAAFSGAEKINATVAALRGARSLGLTVNGMVTVIQAMERKHFYKSTTSNDDHTVWQDVYHVSQGSPHFLLLDASE
jgi:motility quorum-sensing regulator / GCU-specific mRNA interferase toxin